MICYRIPQKTRKTRNLIELKVMNIFLVGMILIDLLGVGFIIFCIFKPEWLYKFGSRRLELIYIAYKNIIIVGDILKIYSEFYKKLPYLMTPELILEALSDLTFLVEEYFKDKEYLSLNNCKTKI